MPVATAMPIVSIKLRTAGTEPLATLVRFTRGRHGKGSDYTVSAGVQEVQTDAEGAALIALEPGDYGATWSDRGVPSGIAIRVPEGEGPFPMHGLVIPS